jgi:hypothetical protein
MALAGRLPGPARKRARAGPGRVAGDQLAGDQLAGDQLAGDQLAGDLLAGDQLAGDQLATVAVIGPTSWGVLASGAAPEVADWPG